MFKRYWRILPLTIAVCPLLGLIAALIITLIQPKLYEATTVLQVRRFGRPIDISPSLGIPDGFSSTISDFSERDLIKTRRTLDIVIDGLDLSTRWNLDRDAARARLEKSIFVQNIKGTDLIEIRIHANSPEDARHLAENLSEAYRVRRIKLETQRTEQALEELRDAVEKHEAAVEEKRKALTSILRNQDLLYRYGGATNSAADAFAELQEQKVLLESQIETLLKYDGVQLMTYAAGLQHPENIIRVLHTQYLDARRNLEALKLSGLGDDHPDVRKQKEAVEGMRRDLDEGVVALRETLRAQLELATEHLARTTEEEDNPFGLTRPLHKQTPKPIKDFNDAKADFETAQRLLEQLKIKLVGEEMQHRISQNPIIIHAEPFIPETPVYPQLRRSLTIGLLSGLAAGIVLPFIILPTLNRRSPN